MFVSAPVRYDGSSISPLAKRQGRRREQQPHDASQESEDPPQPSADEFAPPDFAIDEADGFLDYSRPVLASDLPAATASATSGFSAAPTELSRSDEGRAFYDLLDRVAGKP